MKRLLFILSLIPSLSFAQKITLRAGGGLAATSLSGNGVNYDPKIKPSVMCAATLELGGYTLGLRADMFTIKSSGGVTYYDSLGNPLQGDLTFLKPAIGLAVTGGKVFRHKLIDVHIAVNAGIVTGSKPGSSDVVLWKPGDKNLGFSIGVEAGVSRYFSDHWGVFANLAPRYIFHAIDAYAVPVNLGITLKL